MTLTPEQEAAKAIKACKIKSDKLIGQNLLISGGEATGNMDVLHCIGEGHTVLIKHADTILGALSRLSQPDDLEKALQRYEAARKFDLDHPDFRLLELYFEVAKLENNGKALTAIDAAIDTLRHLLPPAPKPSLGDK